MNGGDHGCGYVECEGFSISHSSSCRLAGQKNTIYCNIRNPNGKMNSWEGDDPEQEVDLCTKAGLEYRGEVKGQYISKVCESTVDSCVLGMRGSGKSGTQTEKRSCSEICGAKGLVCKDALRWSRNRVGWQPA